VTTTSAPRRTHPRIRYGAPASEAAATAVHDLADGLGAMLHAQLDTSADPQLPAAEIRIELGAADALPAAAAPLDGDSFEISRAAGAIGLRSGTERGLIHAAADLLQRLGATFPLGAAPHYPRITRARLADVAPCRVTPDFARRAFVSDIMTWNYNFADRLELHLSHDREFIPWMARHGINAFSYIRHAHDTRLRIDELAPLLRSHGISAEYGGHVLQVLLPRDQFDSHPEYFPADAESRRAPRGNLCVSNPTALAVVRDAAVRYVDDYPENQLLHIWGADVWGGAWCRCGQCIELPPQLQSMEVVNAVAGALAQRVKAAPPVAYLAYHDTIEPHPGLKPLPNVWFEFAPRERCYVHAIDDPKCGRNQRYFDSLRWHIDLFEGRGHVFEYYADAILFGGLGFATPAVVARDLRAYHALGLTSISCLTFGAYSVLAYPVNLDAFVRGARAADFDPGAELDASARERHRGRAVWARGAYRAIARASQLVLDYADVMRPLMPPAKAARKRIELTQAAAIFSEAAAAAGRVMHARESQLALAERELWRYSSEVLAALGVYMGALECSGEERRREGELALSRIAAAIGHVHEIAPELKGTWGQYDLEWLRDLWLGALRRELEHAEPSEETF
jgi:Domain of unknown function (DUF4838)